LKQERTQLNFYTSQFFDEYISSTGFFTRDGGVSIGGYNNLNCGIKSQDLAANIDNNISTVARAFGANTLKQPYQTHSTNVVILDSIDIDSRKIEADAIVTNITKLPIGVVTADCTPILFIDEFAKVIGAAHAGWRGALAGIIENTVDAMEKLGANRKNIQACIGPCIAQTSYEVDANFHQQFLAQSQENNKYFYLSENRNHHMFNLPKYCEDKLKNAGLNTVENMHLDTYTNENLFFSYRRKTHRNEETTGCQMSAIMLK